MRQPSSICPTPRPCKFSKVDEKGYGLIGYFFKCNSLEQELTHYSVLHKGDTINIQYGGRDYAIDIVDTKPDDQICCVETNIEVDFEAPKDYVEPPKIQK